MKRFIKWLDRLLDSTWIEFPELRYKVCKLTGIIAPMNTRSEK